MEVEKINRNYNDLEPVFRKKLLLLMKDMNKAGYDPILFEGKRSIIRQTYLYSIGRSIRRTEKPVTWTLKSRHLFGTAADIISMSKGWNWNEFYDQLGILAIKHGLHRIPQELCHLQM